MWMFTLTVAPPLNMTSMMDMNELYCVRGSTVVSGDSNQQHDKAHFTQGLTWDEFPGLCKAATSSAFPTPCSTVRPRTVNTSLPGSFHWLISSLPSFDLSLVTAKLRGVSKCTPFTHAVGGDRAG